MKEKPTIRSGVMFTIVTKRLELKPMNRAFMASTHSYAKDKEANSYMLHLPSDSIKETEDFLINCEQNWQQYSEQEFELDFAILYQSEHVGGLNLTKIADEDFAEIGWIVNRAFWRQGIAFEAAKAAMQHFSENFHVNHFIARCDSQNQASYALMEKLGMKRLSVSAGRLNKQATKSSLECLYAIVL
ncbi:GNAT family N-acetyltransferase [Streptococcus halichoeri]|uniref:GNAT family N-acetyltransferase n=2 Tax=Streptococcus halichoeri TaxID=254785 RepID=UPI001F370018|nr:GNAT family N-acetyltransferase [Streptococcus halichoeri]